MRSSLQVVPCSQRQAKPFIEAYHRHHRSPRGAIFCLAVIDETRAVRGVATIGRPVARMLDDGFTLEVNRVATDGCPNACSALLGAARRIALAMGYARIITYTLPEEGGASLRGAGWQEDGRTSGDRGWACPKYSHLNRVDDHPLQSKVRWVGLNARVNTDPIQWPEVTATNQVVLFAEPE